MNEVLNIKIKALLDDCAGEGVLGAAFHSLHSRACHANNRVCDFCVYCLGHSSAGSLCRYATCTSAVTAFRSGEPSIQRCWAGLVYFTVPVTENNACVGGVSVGGFYFEGDDVRANIRDGLPAFPERALNAFEERVNSVRQILPGELRGYASYVMELTFTCGINSESFFARQHSKYTQQRQIADALEGLSASGGVRSGLVDDAQQMLSVIEQGDKGSIEVFFSQYLARLLTASNWNLTKLKARLRLLVSILTSREILSGQDWITATSREARNMLRLDEASTVEDSCYEVAQLIMAHLRAQPGEEKDESISIADRAIKWFETHYSEKVLLADAAKAIGASESAIIKSIKRETGKTSKQILREIRVAAARRMLASTEIELSEIAHMCGYYDQSHFSREFQQAANMPPGRFRRLFDKEEMKR